MEQLKNHLKDKKGSKKIITNLDYFTVNGESTHKDNLGFGCPKCEMFWEGTYQLKYYLFPSHMEKYHPEMEQTEILRLASSLPRTIESLSDEGHELLRLLPE